MGASVLAGQQCEVVKFPTRLERSHVGEFVDVFANQRYPKNDPKWVVENGRFLSVLRRIHPDVSAKEMQPYETVCGTLLDELALFPQHYKSYLALALEFQDLGLDNNVGANAADQILQRNLITSELSDVKRCEVKYLLARARAIEPDWSSPLDLRIDAFVRRHDLFRLPNKIAAWELVHLVFYRTAYGEILPNRSDEKVMDNLLISLRAVGILACLDHDTELLSGASLALSMVGGTVPSAWVSLITHTMRQAHHLDEMVDVPDDYHKYLMGCWYLGGLNFGAGCGPDSFAGTSVLLPINDSRPLVEILHICKNEPDIKRVLRHKFYSKQTRQLISELELLGDEFDQILRRIHTLAACY